MAGGLVLGVGATMTLAAWSDDIWVNGQFRAGQFNVQGSPSTTTTHTWGEYRTQAASAPLAFSSVVPTIVSPGTSYYAPFSLAIDSTKADFNGNVQISEYLGTGDPALRSKLTWSATVVSSPVNCTNETGYSAGTPLVPTAQGPATGTLQPLSPASGIVTLDKVLNTTATTPKTVCFKVTVAAQDPADDPSTNPYGTAPAGLVWHFTATSV
nr:SipW-dependent-type signal peptide-containing protein [Dietzia sp. CQ4]